jgi:hypothetical protein
MALSAGAAMERDGFPPEFALTAAPPRLVMCRRNIIRKVPRSPKRGFQRQRLRFSWLQGFRRASSADPSPVPERSSPFRPGARRTRSLPGSSASRRAVNADTGRPTPAASVQDPVLREESEGSVQDPGLREESEGSGQDPWPSLDTPPRHPKQGRAPEPFRNPFRPLVSFKLPLIIRL